MQPRARALLGILLGITLALDPGGVVAPAAPPLATDAATHAPMADSDGDARAQGPRWRWPLEGSRRVSVAYRAPAHEYGAGHRGVDLVAAPGAEVRAPDDGVVAFRGTVVDRPLITIEHDGGLVSTFEPVSSDLAPGTAVGAGDVIGRVAQGGHAAPGDLHVGARRDGAYLNPMLLLGEVERAVLLPCCM